MSSALCLRRRCRRVYSRRGMQIIMGESEEEEEKPRSEVTNELRLIAFREYS